MENFFYQIMINVPEKFSVEDNLKLCLLAKDKFNTKYLNKRRILLLPQFNNRINLLIKFNSSNPVTTINNKHIQYFLKSLIEVDDSNKKKSLFKIEVIKELNKEEVEEIIDDNEENDIKYFDDNDKRLMIESNEEDTDEDEIKWKTLKETQNLKEAIEKVYNTVGYEEIKREVEGIIKYADLLKVNKLKDYKLPFNFIIKAENDDITEKIIKVFGEILFYKKLIKARKYIDIDSEYLVENGWVDINDYYKELKEGILIVKSAQKLFVEDNEYIKSSVLRPLENQMWNKRGNIVTFLIVDNNCDKDVEKLKVYFEKKVNLRFLNVSNYSDDEIETISKKMAKEKCGAAITDDGIKFLIKKVHNKEEIGTIRCIEKIIEAAIMKNLINDCGDTNYDMNLRYEDFIADNEVTNNVIKYSNPMEELNSLIGIESIKSKINEIINYLKMQKKNKELGYEIEPICLHMEFVGNPGTCKTTVARIIGKILKEEGLLEKGEFFEVSREDLVDKYVGWTAPKVVSKVKEALGSVLFVDEAYSLYDDDSASFGSEAITALMKEMENHKDELVVILAGYPKEMDKLIGSNPGLKDRIAFKVQFPDYSPEELNLILKKMIVDKGYTIPSKAYENTLTLFKEEIKYNNLNFGNGRYVRKLFERIQLMQAKRIGEIINDVDREEIKHITENDVELAVKEMRTKKEDNGRNRIGF